jgi:hypothetical protein
MLTGLSPLRVSFNHLTVLAQEKDGVRALDLRRLSLRLLQPAAFHTMWHRSIIYSFSPSRNKGIKVVSSGGSYHDNRSRMMVAIKKDHGITLYLSRRKLEHRNRRVPDLEEKSGINILPCNVHTSIQRQAHQRLPRR